MNLCLTIVTLFLYISKCVHTSCNVTISHSCDISPNFILKHFVSLQLQHFSHNINFVLCNCDFVSHNCDCLYHNALYTLQLRLHILQCDYLTGIVIVSLIILTLFIIIAYPKNFVTIYNKFLLVNYWTMLLHVPISYCVASYIKIVFSLLQFYIY